jgi:ferredoxin-NADP reductase
MNVALAKKEKVAKDTYMFWFEPEKPVEYVAGQYIELHLPHENPDERKTRRWFTLSSSPTEKLLAITTRFHTERTSSFKTRLNGLKPGEIITMMPPMGDFVLPKDPSIPLLFIAGGIGITPYRSMLKYLSDKGESRNIRLIYAVTSKEYAAFEDLIKKSSAKYELHLGHMAASDLDKFIEPKSGQAIYISGPEKMVERLQGELFGKGVDIHQLRVDFFHNYD